MIVTLLRERTGGQSELNQAILALEDGTVFEGKSFGAQKDRTGEVVFNTATTGYQEIFTDPSYSGQIVVLTNPQIGNYGANEYDEEAARPHIEGLVVREFSPIASNWRSEENAEKFLADQGIPVAAEIDTRALVRHLRTRGVMRGILSVEGGDPKDLIERARQARLHRSTLSLGQTGRTLLALRTAPRTGRTVLPRSRLRFRDQTQHPETPCPGRRARNSGPRAHRRRRCSRPQPRRHLPLKRSRRSRASTIPS